MVDVAGEGSGVTPATRRIWSAAAVAVAAWAMQLMLGWYVAAHACPTATEPLRLATARVVVGVIGVVALAAAIAGLIAAGRLLGNLRAAENGEPVPASPERVRFVAMLGFLVCLTLGVGILMGGLPALFVRTCGEMR